jgi:hypothetical protein
MRPGRVRRFDLSLTSALTDTIGDVPPQVTQALFIVEDSVFDWLAASLWIVSISIVLFRRGSRAAEAPPPRRRPAT